MVTLKQLKAVQTADQLQDLNIGHLIIDISHRGGGVGYTDKDIEKHFNVLADLLPNRFGASCNYLGGGVRGSIVASNFSNNITQLMPRKAKLLTELAAACVRVYKSIEDESNMNEEVDEDGETNWDAMATKAARAAGLTSSY
jgi:hypothetical protein